MFLTVEQRASRVPDPLAKLRFLRASQARQRNAAARFRRFARRAAAGGTALAAVFTVVLLLRAHPSAPAPRPASRLAPLPPKPVPSLDPEPIFLVEHSASADLYSNGLQIRSTYQTASAPRSYISYARDSLQPSPPQTVPSGIVFHTTESLLPPIEAKAIQSLNRSREAVLAFVREKRSYNFVIDRFGQVFRVVPEDQTAYHAGHSIWADASTVFLDLNESFVGVAFEMHAGEVSTAAQQQAARLLTAMLRSVYNIADANCVTHAQVSVNPDNLRIGYHTDWGGGFPFREAGLNVGYAAPVAAVELFGFGYDEHFLDATGGHPWAGLLAAERQILIDAGARGLTAARYRTILQQHYQALRRHHHDRS